VTDERDELVRLRRLSTAVLVTWFVLCALQMGRIEPLQHWWAVNLWAYQGPWAGVAAAVLAWPVASSRVREWLVQSFTTLPSLPRSRPVRLALVATLVAVALWLVRDTELSPDAQILIAAALTKHRFIFPDVGGSWIIISMMHVGSEFPGGSLQAIRALVCVAGGLSFVMLAEIGRRLLASERGGWAIAALVFSTGLVRVFAGRVEVYGFLLTAACLYVMLALRYVQDGRGWWTTCLAAGAAVWLHPASLLLLPGLVVLPYLTDRDGGWRRWLGTAAAGVMVAAVPGLVFLALIAMTGGGDAIATAVTTAREVAGEQLTPHAKRWWVRGWGGAPSVGTDYVFGSATQLKYLGNCAFLLCPAALAALVAAFAAGPRMLARDRELRFLGAMCAALVVYSFALRAFWGPFDWDLFSITALLLTLAGARAASITIPRTMARHALVAAIVLQALFIAAPMLALRTAPPRDAGPFAVTGYLHPDLHAPQTPPPAAIEPWL